jgi:RNA polymerase sigma-70 factor (ECF subfamily)
VGSTADLQIQSGQGLVAGHPTTDWDWLYAHHSRVLYRRVLGIVRNPEDAEDVLQEGLLSAFTNFHRFEGRSGLSTWLTRIVINSALMQLRSRRSHEAVSLDESLNGTTAPTVNGLMDSNPNPEQLCLMRERRRVLARSIGGLSPNMQTVVSLRYTQGLSTREAARNCGISENTLKARLRRARLRLAHSKSLFALL